MNSTEEFKKIILGDIRYDMNIYFEYYFIDCKNNIFCLETQGDHQMTLVGEPYSRGSETLWYFLLDSSNDEQFTLVNWKFLENFPLKVTTNLGETLEICPLS